MAVEIGRQLLFAVFPLALAYAAASDLLTMTIANRLVAAMVAAFVLMAPIAGLAWNEIVMHFAAGAAVIAIAFAFFAAGWIGGGDAKFAARPSRSGSAGPTSSILRSMPRSSAAH